MVIFYICSFVIREMLTSYVEQLIILTIIVPLSEASGNCPCTESNGNTKEPHKVLSHVEEEQVTERHRKKCCPYNFDGKLCRTVGDRVLCGYERNVGGSDDNNNIIDLQNGCRLKNGRLECGYYQPPYTYSPRPPVLDIVESEPDKPEHEGDEVKLLATESSKPSEVPIRDNDCNYNDIR